MLTHSDIQHLPAGAALPVLPPSVPSVEYPAWIQALGRWIMRVLGWHFVGGFADEPRQVLVAAPHTSNWDGIVGLAAAAVCGVSVKVFAKRQLFVGPVGWLLRLFGGVPVDRSKPGGLVERGVEALTGEAPAFVAVTPEGTRSAVERWKTGFHRMAVEAEVPIAVVAIDWGRRQVGVVGTLRPSGDLEGDLAAIGVVLEGVKGKHPERATIPSAGSRLVLEDGPHDGLEDDISRRVSTASRTR